MKTNKFPESEEVKNILVVRQHNQIGDMLCSLPLYAALKKKYPNSTITLVAAKTSYEIPFSELNLFLDRVIIFDKQNLKTIFAFFRKLRNRKYQLGIVPSTVKLSRTSHIINFLSGARVRVGVKSIDGNINRSHKLLSIKSSFEWKHIHQMERNLDVVRQIGCDLAEDEKELLKFRFSDDEKSNAGKFIEEKFPDKNKKIIAFHPGAGKEINRWNANNFIGLIKKLFAGHSKYILISSGLTDEKVIKYVCDELDKCKVHYERAHNLPVRKLASLLSGVNLYITNDTGALQIAGFSNVKLISLFGPTDPAEWAPSGENQYFIKSKTGNIDDISVDEVFNLSKKILEDEK